MMRRLLEWMLIGIALLSVTQKFVVNFGVNIRLHELLFAPFIALGFLYFSIHRPSIPRPLLIMLGLKWLLVAVALASVVNIPFCPVGISGLVQYGKGVASLIADTCVLSVTMFLLASISARRRRRILWVLLGAVLLSTVYGLVQLVAMIGARLDIDAEIARLLPIFSSAAPGLERYAVGNFYRFTGLTGDPNVQASFLISYLSFTLVYYLYQRSFFRGLLLGGGFVMMILTMSNSGIVGLAVCLAGLTILYAKRIQFPHLLLGGVIVLALIPLVTAHFDDIIHLFKSRTDLNGTAASHLQIADLALKMWWRFPNGCGYNNFSGVFNLLYPEWSDMNPHNSYLSVLCELGVPGLLVSLSTLCYVISEAAMQRTLSGRYLVCWCLGICIAACGYETFELFYNQLFWVVVFCVVCFRDNIFLSNSSSDKQRRIPVPERAAETARASSVGIRSVAN